MQEHTNTLDRMMWLPEAVMGLLYNSAQDMPLESRLTQA